MKDRYITSISWHLCEDMLPPESGEYLTYGKTLGVRTLPYSHVHQAFNAYDHADPQHVARCHINVLAWAHHEAVTTLFKEVENNEKNS